MTLIDRSYQIGTYKCGFLFALVSSSENIEAFTYTFAGTLVNIHSPKININTAGAPIWTKKSMFEQKKYEMSIWWQIYYPRGDISSTYFKVYGTRLKDQQKFHFITIDQSFDAYGFFEE